MTKRSLQLRVVSDTESIGDDDLESDAVHTDITTDATLTEVGGRIELGYDEILSDDGEYSHTLIAFDRKRPQTVFLTRTGFLNMTCAIEENMRYRFTYDIGIAAFEMISVGKKVKNSLLDSSGTLRMTYDLELRGMTMRRCSLRLTIM